LKPLLALILGTGSVLWSSHPALEQVEKAIHERGAAKVVDELNRQRGGSPWESIEYRVATGNGGWLQIAKQVRVYTDAGVSESLDNAIAEALPRNAEGVLGILGGDPSKEFTVERTCSAETYIEVSRASLRRHFQIGIAAVERVNDPHLHDAKVACVIALKRGLN
jgi:hypothetical protein